jgi:hypothetical protein
MMATTVQRDRKASGCTRRLFRLALFTLTALALVTAGLWFWYTHRPIPKPTQETLFEGVTYIRDVRRDPRPLVIYVVVVELDAPGIGFLVTPGDPDAERPLRARKTSQFLEEFGLQVAINGDYFKPWHSNAPWDYYPHVGDPVSVVGFASAEGAIYSSARGDRMTLYVSRTNAASFGQPRGAVYNAISGNRTLVAEGEIVRGFFPGYERDLHPRTAIGLDREEKRLILVVVDGRQPNYSEGVNLRELAEIMRAHGAYTAVNLDGGGSSTLVVEADSGRPQILNSPIDNRIPGRERPVANHLGVYARRSLAAED